MPCALKLQGQVLRSWSGFKQGNRVYTITLSINDNVSCLRISCQHQQNKKT